ncbi:hypothetical protein [Mucilaginibacter sp.]|uniref:hypothetical protein n=1 Tax=Mucilaginibacter sp. TaxID=1882438 RepID=UPI003D0E7A85
MTILLKNISVCLLAVCLYACKKPAQNVPHYTVSKVIKTDTLTTLNVHISNRMTGPQLVLIAGKLKSDSTAIQNLEIHYLLPGNADITAGDNSYYASLRYLKDADVKATDTLKDENDKVVRLKIFGISQTSASHLLSLQPKETAGKNIMGRFIDDYNHTVIIPFKDPLDKKDELYVIELDSAAKVVSATVPLKVVDGATTKWQVTQHGDYLTLKDSVLAQYAVDGLGMPFNSIKSGI